MKKSGGYFVVALVLGLVSAVLFTIGFLDRDVADAEQRGIAADYRPLTDVLDKAERYYGYASRVPGVGSQSLNDVRARKAALQYWQHNYGALVQDPSEPFAAVPAENVDLQFLVASALYRQNLARAKDRASTVEALDASIEGYRTVLKNAHRHEDAAYNFEYLIRLRNEINKGTRKSAQPSTPQSPHGSSGARQEETSTETFKIYVPLESEERNNTGGEAGKASVIKRKG